MVLGSAELVLGSAELVPVSAELVPGLAELVPGLAEMVPGSAELVPGSAELVPGSAELDRSLSRNRERLECVGERLDNNWLPRYRCVSAPQLCVYAARASGCIPEAASLFLAVLVSSWSNLFEALQRVSRIR